MPDIRLAHPPAWTTLGTAWRALEARANGSFFQSWSWVGTRIAERFPDPILLEARQNGAVVAMALFNRRRGPLGTRLWLNESGQTALDRIHVEHNGLLIAASAPPGLLTQAVAHLSRAVGHVVLSGVDAAHLDAAQATGALVRARAHPAASPWIDLAAVRAQPGGHLALLSANTRHQLRRSLRRYEQDGPFHLHRAGSLAEAHDFLAALAVLHQRTWTGRGQPGAFANPAFAAFHADLLATAWPRGEADLLRVAAGTHTLGYLYNFRWRNRIANYQTGFDYNAAPSPHHKPGLTCHHLAAEMYAAEGLDAYDLLAGDHRYKTSLATDSATLHWVEMMPKTSLAGRIYRARAAIAKQGWALPRPARGQAPGP